MQFTDLPQTIVAWVFYLIIYVPVLLIVWRILIYGAKKTFNFNSRKKAWLLLLLIIFSPTLWMIPRIMILGGYYCFKQPSIFFKRSYYNNKLMGSKYSLKVLKYGVRTIPIYKYPAAIFFEYEGGYYMYAPNLEYCKFEKCLKSLRFYNSREVFFDFFDQRLVDYYEYKLSDVEIKSIQYNMINVVELFQDRNKSYAFSLGGIYYLASAWTGDMFDVYFSQPQALFNTMHAVSCENDPDVSQLPNLLLKLKQSK